MSSSNATSKFDGSVSLYSDELRAFMSAKFKRKFSRDNVAEAIRTTRQITGKQVVCMESLWMEKRRPFFNVHAPILRSLVKTPLSIKPNVIPRSIVHELGVMCIKFPIGYDEFTIRHFFVGVVDAAVIGYEERELSRQVAIAFHTSDACFCSHIPMDKTFADFPNSYGATMTNGEDLLMKKLSRIAIGTMLLAADPAFIKPIILRKDTGKNEDIESLAERAKKRGVFGFEIGADMETSPHFRRPHFGIRWTGRGGKIPKLVPIKGSVIHKDMLRVPTGYLDEVQNH